MTEFKQSGYGTILRQRREELGLSLNDLAASTRVRKTYLQALEEENLRMLPGAAYSIGFLRIYARQLGLPVEPLLAALAGDTPLEEPAALSALGGELPRGAKKPTGKRKTARLLFLVMLLLLLLGVAGYLYLGKKTQLLSLPAPVPVPATQTPAQPPAQPVPPPVPPPASPSTTGAPAASPSAADQAVVVPAELPVIPAAGAVVRMLPVAAGTMKVSLDSQEVREYQLQPDQSLNWKVSASLAVELSAPGLARVWVDQQEIAIAEQAAFILKGVAKAQGRP